MKVIISAGGTGGHIYPAIAIVNKIKEMEPKSEILYIGTHDRMEKEIVPKLGIPYEEIEMYGFYKKNLLKNFKTIKALLNANKKCRKLISDFDPDVVIGVGGYVTVPVLKMANKLKYKTFLHEQNTIPGKSNLYLASLVNKIFISFESSEKYFKKEKVVLTGNPCSEEAKNVKAALKSEFNLTENKPLILFVMGSLGASKVNDFLINTMMLFNNKNYEVLFVTGKKDFERVSKINLPRNVKVVPYIDNLTRIMKKTDIMVTRAGASTLSEIISLELPSIIIPSPYVTNNHQYKNASDLVNKNAAYMIEEKDLIGDVLVRSIDSLMMDFDKIDKIKKNLKSLQIDNSALMIYNELKKMIDED